MTERGRTRRNVAAIALLVLWFAALVAGVIAVALAFLPARAAAQTSFSTAASGVKAPGTVAMTCNAQGKSCTAVGPASPLPTVGFQEGYQLVAANVASAAATVAGGDYVLDQTCATYGTLKLQRLGPDGTTWLDTLTKSASDTTTGSGVTLGGGAQVRIVLSGTTGCYAMFSRVPG